MEKLPFSPKKSDWCPFYLQNTVEELGDKLVARDEEIAKKERKNATLKAELERKNIEHQETVSQVKKLTQQVLGINIFHYSATFLMGYF